MSATQTPSSTELHTPQARYDAEGWTLQEFFEKLDYEGGVAGLLAWGGPGVFPPECRARARIADAALRALHERIDELEDAL